MLPLGVAGGSAVETHDIDGRIFNPGFRRADVTEITTVDPALASSRAAAVGRSDRLGGRSAFPILGRCRHRACLCICQGKRKCKQWSGYAAHWSVVWFDESKTRGAADR